MFRACADALCARGLSPRAAGFMIEKRPLGFDAPAVAAERSALPHNAMARHHQRGAVRSARSRNRARGRRLTKPFRHCGIGARLSGRNGSQLPPDLVLKNGAAQMQRHARQRTAIAEEMFTAAIHPRKRASDEPGLADLLRWDIPPQARGGARLHPAPNCSQQMPRLSRGHCGHPETASGSSETGWRGRGRRRGTRAESWRVRSARPRAAGCWS